MSLSPTPERHPRRVSAPTRLKAHAIGLLSRREHSRQELRAKLLQVVRRRHDPPRHDADIDTGTETGIDTGTETGIGIGTDTDTDTDGYRDADADAALRADAAPARAADAGAADLAEDTARQAEVEVDALLDWLAQQGYLSDTRFVEGRVHQRAARQGLRRIEHELSRHGLALDAAQAQALRETELERARAVWARKFGHPGADARERARQARFLAARGFAGEVIRRLVGGDDDDLS